MPSIENFQAHTMQSDETSLESDLDKQIDEAVGKDASERTSENHRLNDDEVIERYNRLRSYWQYEKYKQADDRLERIKDHDYHDGDQWSEDDKRTLENRLQKPIVFNQIKPVIAWIVGTERRTRVDFRVMPRSANDEGAAKSKTGILKYLNDVNRMGFKRSDAFQDAAISGLGWLEVGYDASSDKEKIYLDYEDWRNMWHDSQSTQWDYSDSRYMFRSKIVDTDIACAMFPDRIDVIKASSSTNLSDLLLEDEEYPEIEEDVWGIDTENELSAENYLINTRHRCQLVEAWYRQPEYVNILRGDDLGLLSGEIFDEENQGHLELINQGLADVVQTSKMVMRVMIFTKHGVLHDSRSPYRHNRFPFIPLRAFKRKKDGRIYGVVRNLRDPQEDLNKRMSKALFILSTQRVIADENATDNWDELWDEASRPDGRIKKRPGTEVTIVSDNALAGEHVSLMQYDREYIQSSSGVTDELLGRDTRAVSGKAILARQEQGHVVTSELYDNLRQATQHMGELMLSLVEQFMTDSREIRIVGSEYVDYKFKPVNQLDQETGEIIDDVTARAADFVVDTAAWTATVRQATFEALLNLLPSFPPEITVNLLDAVMELGDFPGKNELVSRIREVNGQSDPHEDPNDPEVIAREEEKARKLAEEEAYNNATRELALRNMDADAKNKDADSEYKLAKADADRSNARMEKAKTVNQLEDSEFNRAKISTDMINQTIRDIMGAAVPQTPNQRRG